MQPLLRAHRLRPKISRYILWGLTLREPGHSCNCCHRSDKPPPSRHSPQAPLQGFRASCSNLRYPPEKQHSTPNRPPPPPLQPYKRGDPPRRSDCAPYSITSCLLMPPPL